MKVSIYIDQKNFDKFFAWVKELELGNLSSPPVFFSHLEKDVEDPLRVSLDPNMYFIIQDAMDDLDEISGSVGPFNMQYEHDSKELHLQRIKESLRNAKRLHLECDLIYLSLITMKEIPSITPTEAIIIAEKSLSSVGSF